VRGHRQLVVRTEDAIVHPRSHHVAVAPSAERALVSRGHHVVVVPAEQRALVPAATTWGWASAVRMRAMTAERSPQSTSPQPGAAPVTHAPFRVEIVTVTGLTIPSIFPLELAFATAIGYAEDREGVPMRTPADRIALRTVVLRFYSELLDEQKPLEVLDDEGVAWVLPPERVLAVRVIDPERSPGPPAADEVRHIGFQLRRPAVAGGRREATEITPIPASDAAHGEAAIRPKSELD